MFKKRNIFKKFNCKSTDGRRRVANIQPDKQKVDYRKLDLNETVYFSPAAALKAVFQIQWYIIHL